MSGTRLTTTEPGRTAPRHDGGGTAQGACRLSAAPDDVGRILISLVADELARQRRRSVDHAEWRSWTDETVLDEDGLGIDSLSRLSLVARVSRFFSLHRTGVEDYLLVRRRLSDWTAIAIEGIRRLPADDPVTFAFETSGSSGEPKIVTHDLAFLQSEIDASASLFAGAERIVTLVPPHHLYGFLFTVLLPATLGLAVTDARGRSPGSVAAGCRTGDLIVGSPFLWQVLADTGVRLPDGVTGLTSTAPMPAELWNVLRRRGLDRLVEIYGSTETAGLGTREAPERSYRTMPHLDIERGGEGDLRFVHRASGRRLTPPDDLEPEGSRRFRHLRRSDGAVQVGGTNVYPDHVAAVLRSLEGVADCAVRPDGVGADRRLKAYVVPEGPVTTESSAEAELLTYLRRQMAIRLRPPERPVSITFGDALPLDQMGKSADWL